MKILLFVFLCVSAVFFCSCVGESEPEPPTQQQNDKVYIVYMGAAAPSSNGAMRKDQAQLITSLTKRNRNALVYTYTNGFCGFSARLSEEEAGSIAQNPGVVSVFPDPILQLQTTRSWDFLDSISYTKISPTNLRRSTSTAAAQPLSSSGADTIIGILDSGIWPESPSFNDDGMGPIPARWKGKCEEGDDFNSSNCNRKLIGARYYPDVMDVPSARDSIGHGSHVASTAAGSLVDDASYYGQARGTARGGSPTSRIAMYRVCENVGCQGSAILKGFDDGIKDGVDVLSLSLGGFGGLKPDFSTDVIAIGAFHAVERGIVVVCAAGNSGPDRSSVVNEAPWIFTVAASTIDRDFQSQIILGDGTVIKGGGIYIGKLKKSTVYPLATGASVKLENATKSNARDCLPMSLDPEKAKGKIILCETRDSTSYIGLKIYEVKNANGVAVILVSPDPEDRIMALKLGGFPGSIILEKEANQIFSYISSTKNPVATILPTVTVTGNKPAPAVVYFSSRGPSLASVNLLKPDICAPGVDILAAWPDIDGDEIIPVKSYPGYNLISGTSMACPHTSGIVATVKAQNPNFSVSAIRSAVMTTAMQTNNLNAPITTTDGAIATPYDIGAGELNPTAALNPGLVYETEIADYLHFLCATGYNTSQIRLISSTVPKGFKCPKKFTEDVISAINYPSIAVSNLKKGEPKAITRTVSNVGPEESVYTATIEALTNIEVTVTPNKLVFTKQEKKLSYTVIFTASSSLETDTFGSITWTSGKYRVRSPIVVSVE
ncbi:PREDICTED: CO(2)-response secreted protease-like [Ipomoea nil]|uniref:CO(2)-response secreted protease-like n=1 Tax=Ipomoea nil TaxID=35883 RepID=UPI000900A519|nr:PREDICTED: CO(2)-response secreted protease-like [Ipomoea nil]